MQPGPMLLTQINGDIAGSQDRTSSFRGAREAGEPGISRFRVRRCAPPRNDPENTFFNSKHEFHVANAVLDGIGLHLETEVAAHRQHHGVFRKHIP